MKISLFKILYIKFRFWLKYRLSKSVLAEFNQLSGKKKCLVMLAADYGNLGDVAITYAQEKFLKERFPEYEIVDVPISKTLSHLKSLQSICSSDDIITIVGGGNMSDLYFDIELLRQMVVEAFPNNRIISFPQTMFFSDTPAGRYLRKRAKRIYSKHKHLTIAAREETSYKTMRAILPQTMLLPDIVMTLDKREPVSERKGITLCLRQDAETNLTRDLKEELILNLNKDSQITLYDTHIGRGKLNLAERKEELCKIWKQFRGCEWVITDRLHGMIFAFITGTPCIVLPNNNFKIEGCYQWIANCGYIHYVNELIVDNICNIVYDTKNSKKGEYYIISFEKIMNKLLSLDVE